MLKTKCNKKVNTTIDFILAFLFVVFTLAYLNAFLVD